MELRADHDARIVVDQQRRKQQRQIDDRVTEGSAREIV
jgi:hypothetical protein